MRRDRLAIVPAAQLALENLGRPVPVAVLLGGLAALSGVVSPDAVGGAIRERFPGSLADGNAAAADKIVAEQQEDVASRAAPA